MECDHLENKTFEKCHKSSIDHTHLLNFHLGVTSELKKKIPVAKLALSHSTVVLCI